MLHVEDDNDELLRRAAEEYPLQTGKGDWESLRSKLDAVPLHSAPIASGPHNRKYLWLLLLLIPLAFYYLNKFSPEHSKEIAGNQSTITTNTNATTGGNAYNYPSLTSQDKNIEDKAFSKNQNSALINTIFPNERYTNERYHDQKKLKGNAKAKIKTSNNSPLFYNDNSDNITYGMANINQVKRFLSRIEISIQPSELEFFEEAKVIPVGTGKDSAGKKPDHKPGSRSTGRKFYAGVTGGPDITVIKMQSMKKSGYSYGLIAGYKLGNKWSVETGFLWDKKNYYTNGKYFNTAKLQMPPVVKINSVNGSCRMTELPLNVRYTFTQKKKQNWFATAGISSYFMNSEDYVYDVSYGVYQSQRPYSYKTRSTALAAVLNITGGLSRRIGNSMDLRAEPYLRIPLKKVGTGSLPLQSGGIMIGITRDLF